MSPARRGRWIVGLDIGGTFTDVVMVDPARGRVARYKALTTPDDPALGALMALDSALAEGAALPGSVATLLHATTLVSNALIERKGARTALVTTEGFRDVVDIAREKKYDIYDIFLEKPRPLAPRQRRFEVRERVAADGRVLVPLGPASVRRVAHAIAASAAEAVAVCLLHAYVNPGHERRLGALLARLLPGIPVSLSSDILPEIREYERATTTLANAFVQPLMAGYLGRLGRGLRAAGVDADVFIMLSSGGIATPDIVRRFPVRIVESGPAAGAITAATVGRQLAAPRILSFDMGGTTAKTCLIHEGRPVVTTDFEVARIYRFKKGSGLPLKIPVVDLIEIGAGGGSIARVDGLGLLKVGPDSAGASPGPACYGLGGTQPTVTDADLVLGYLDPESFLGGRMRLHPAKAWEAIRQHVAEPAGLEVEEAAWGIHAIVNENMANAARIHAVERGQDPAAYALVAFGGAGPVHAWDVARRLGISTIVVPPSAGLGSAVGLLLAPRSYQLVRTLMARLDAVDWRAVNRAFASMTREAAGVLRRAGVGPRQIRFTYTADMRYVGQRKEVTVELASGRLGPRDVGAIRRAFERRYAEIYHRRHVENQVEALNWRLVAVGPPITGGREIRLTARRRARLDTPRSRRVFFPEWQELRPCRVRRRESLPVHGAWRGPLLIEEAESTIAAGPGSRVGVDRHGNLLIHLPARERGDRGGA